MTVLSNQQDIDILITDAEISARTNQLARIITDHFKGTEQLVVVGLLRGSFIFYCRSCAPSGIAGRGRFYDGVFLWQ